MGSEDRYFPYNTDILQSVINLAYIFGIISRTQAWNIQCYEHLGEIAFRNRHRLTANVAIDAHKGMVMQAGLNFNTDHYPSDSDRNKELTWYFVVECNWPNSRGSKMTISVYRDEGMRQLCYRLMFKAEENGTVKLKGIREGRYSHKAGITKSVVEQLSPACLGLIRERAKRGSDIARKILPM